MPISVPQSARETWGDRVAEDVAQWLDEHFQQRAVTRDEYREVLSRLDVIEERLDQIDGRLGRIETRIDRVEDRIDQQSAAFNQRLDALNERLDQQRSEFDQRLDAMHEQMRVMMRWTVGTIALFGTLITVLIAIAEFAP
jgi:tetrahydromethanopterin S-methyltransferase subunit G